MKRRSIAHTLTRAPFSKALLGVGLLLTLAGLRPGSQLSGAPLRAQQPPRQAGVAELSAARRVAKRIDEAVLRDLRRFGIEPAERCDDATFLRRVHIDLFAELPPAEDVRRFVADRRKDKRERLVHLMLADKRYADAWALKFSDMLRIKAEFPINLWPNAAQCYYQWVWSSLRQNRPWSEMLRELVTSSGSNFRVPTVNFYRAVQRKSPEGIAAVAALTLLGQRYEKWSEARQQGFAAFFCRVGYKPTQEWKEEIVHFDRFKELPKGSPGADGIARCPGASVTQLLEGVDPRVQLADALLSKENPHVARAMANRIWFWLLGRGVVHEADDLRDDNPPANPRLLELLTAELQRSGYDMQHLIRSILLSGTYQQSVKAKTRSPLAESHFAYYVPRRMDAEMLIDAICALTGTSEDYSSKIPEPFTFIPPSLRATTLPDGSISSSFLEMFGKPTRDSGMLSERNNKVTATQRLHLLNSSHIIKKLQNSRSLMAIYWRTRRNPARMIDDLYLTILSRYPSQDERESILRLAKEEKLNGRDAFVDLAWALVNTSEFQLRH
jgi:hypothetical protein